MDKLEARAHKRVVTVLNILAWLVLIAVFSASAFVLDKNRKEIDSLKEEIEQMRKKPPRTVERIIKKTKYVYLSREEVNKVIRLLEARGQINLVHEFFFNYVQEFIRNNGHTQDADVTKRIVATILSESREKDIPVILAFSLAEWESSFDPNDVNRNGGGSRDIGLYQCNTETFSGIPRREFFDIERNTELGLWFLKQKYRETRSWRKAIIKYNAGNLKRIYGTSINHFDNVFEIEEDMMARFCETFGKLL